MDIITSEASYKIETRFEQKPNGKFACLIPALNIYFTAKKKEDIPVKAAALTRIYFNHYLNEFDYLLNN